MKVIATAIAIATTALALTPNAACAAEEPTRVLIVGDSVTQGSSGDYTWRYFAARELGSSVDLVGNRAGTIVPNAGYNWDGTYADPNFDSDHAARWGLSLHEMRYEPSALAPSIGTLVAEHQPDVVVETLGINDLNYRYGEAYVGEVVDNARAFVVAARAADPDVDVVLGTLPQTWIAERVGRYNEALVSLAAELSTDASRVTVTAPAGWDRDADTTDGTHPTRSGQEKLAAVVVEAVTPLLPTPAAAPVEVPESAPAPAPLATPAVGVGATTQAVVAPAKPARVRATQKGKRVVVRWQRAEGAESYVVRCGGKSKTTSATRAVLRGKAARCKVRSVGASVSPWTVVRVKQQR